MFDDALEHATDDWRDLLDRAGLADPDPWGGFASYVTAVGVMQARDRGIADLVTMDVTRAPEIDALRARAFEGLVTLVARAHAAGALRADFTTQDVVLLLMANAGLVERAHAIAEGASARLVYLLLDGLRASAGATEEAMRLNSEHRLGASARKAKQSRTVCPQATTHTTDTADRNDN